MKFEIKIVKYDIQIPDKKRIINFFLQPATFIVKVDVMFNQKRQKKLLTNVATRE